MEIKKTIKMIGGYTFRWIGYPVEPRLVEIGKPNRASPVLVTCNFILTVERVIRALKGVDCYLLIAPSKGINVWCGACGGDFNTESVISILKTSRIEEKVNHRTLILPQLSAPGIDPVQLKKELGWAAKFGPVDAKDVPKYLQQNFSKSEKMRRVTFPVMQRYDMGNVYFYSLFLIFSIIFGIASLFFAALNIHLYVNSVILLFLVIYGSLIILPSIKWQNPKLKVAFFEFIVLILIGVVNGIIIPNIFYLIWNMAASVLITLILIEDFNGLTPTHKSVLGEKTWNKGKDKMNFGVIAFPIQPYGEIYLDREKCIGCKMCIEACPRILFSLDDTEKKVNLSHPENCINCNACVKRCLANCLQIIGEKRENFEIKSKVRNQNF